MRISDWSSDVCSSDLGRLFCRADLQRAIMLGAVERVRPKMMTVIAIMAGLVPILWSTGTGSEVMQRIAAPTVGGTVSSTVLTLIVIPAVYGLINGWRLRCRSEEHTSELQSLMRIAYAVFCLKKKKK